MVGFVALGAVIGIWAVVGVMAGMATDSCRTHRSSSFTTYCVTVDDAGSQRCVPSTVLDDLVKAQGK